MLFADLHLLLSSIYNRIYDDVFSTVDVFVVICCSPPLDGSVLLGYFYPSLASAKAAVQQDPAAFTQWMTYWWVHL